MKENKNNSEIKIPGGCKEQTLLRALVPGKDFAFLKSKSRPILLRSGAEKIRSRLKLQIESLICVSSVTDREKEFLDFTYRCIIRNNEGIITGISEGSSNSLEECFKDRFIQCDINQITKDEYKNKLRTGDGKWVNRNGKWLWYEKICGSNIIGMKNYIQKTAQKRAFVGAVLMASGLYDIFNQN
ncbi:MAG: hypothetical protein PHN88_02155 [Ignavibacteria bacterium]|nr:hypothetical protein [Ignavibacteria bacterium]